MNEEIEALKLELYDSYISDIGITQKTYKRLNDLLNLIEKQQKEIENSISKDKIREKIKDFEEIRDIIAVKENIDLNYDMKRNDYCIKMLNELLEEE